MKILQTVVKWTMKLGIDVEQVNQKNQLNRHNIWSLFVLSLSTISCLIYLCCNANTFAEYTYAVSVLSSMLVATIILAIIIWKVPSLAECLNLMGKFCEEKSKNPASRKLIDKTIPQVEKWTKIIIFANMKVSFPLAMLSRFTISFIVYFTTNAGNDAFELVLPFWFPFDWKNPIGYVVAFILQCMTMLYVNLLISIAIGSGVGVYMLTTIVIKDIENSLEAINGMAKFKTQRTLILKQLNDAVNTHSTGKRLMQYGSVIGQPIFMVLFTWSLITICGAMLILNTQISQNGADNLVVFVVPFFELFWSFGLVFITCEISGRMSSGFDDIDATVAQLKWYSFPYDAQKLLPIIILNAQQEIGIECFGSLMCNRETFKKVVNSSFSYFMVLREF